MATRFRGGGLRLFYMRRKRSYDKSGNIVFFLILLLFAVVASIFLFNFQLAPVVAQMANTRVNYVASKIINDAIDEQIEKQNIKYDLLVSLEKDTDGKITAVKTDMSEANRLRTDIVAIILERIANADSEDLSIPIGNIMPTKIFTGRGPVIPIKIAPMGSSNATFENVFSSAGINQTRHQIIMNISIYISVIIPGLDTYTQINSQVNIAETLIIGTVPGNYTYFEDTSSAQNAAEKYFIYGD